MKIAILGYDVEGRASYDYFAAQGHELTICDQNPDLQVPAGVPSVLGEPYLDDLDRFDLIVRTAGLHPQKILDKNPTVGPKITTHINEFMKASPTRHIIGVTGTKGKGTTSTLIAEMLAASGKEVTLAGNIGLPPLSTLNKLSVDSWVVLELSSFQLIDLKLSPTFGVCLMIVPEHLNWHVDMSEYLEAKAQLFTHQTLDDTAVYFADNEYSRQIAALSPGRAIPYFAKPGAIVSDTVITIEDQVICQLSELKLRGHHNWQNICAAITTVWQIAPNVAATRQVLTTFHGLPHRLEEVREVDGVLYVDDSFGTTPETAVVALEAFSQPKVLIAGGSDKGSDYQPLVDAIVKQNVKHVVCIGITGKRIAALLEGHKSERKVPYTTWTSYDDVTMPEVVDKACSKADTGDMVLLSPGSASFGMFKNYKDRGEQFQAAVQALS